MDLRVLVLTADSPLAGLIRAQVDNLGCTSAVAADYEEAASALEWADAVFVDLVDGLDDLARLRADAPTLPIVAVAPDAEVAARATAEGAHSVLVEPFSISDIVERVRGLGHAAGPATVDLRGTGATIGSVASDDKPWWATR